MLSNLYNKIAITRRLQIYYPEVIIPGGQFRTADLANVTAACSVMGTPDDPSVGNVWGLYNFADGSPAYNLNPCHANQSWNWIAPGKYYWVELDPALITNEDFASSTYEDIQNHPAYVATGVEDNTIEVLENTGVTVRKEYQDYLTNVPCLIQPLEAQVTPDFEGSFGKDFLVMCGIADIKETDRILIDGLEYRITGIERHDWQGHSHLEITVRIFKG